MRHPHQQALAFQAMDRFAQRAATDAEGNESSRRGPAIRTCMSSDLQKNFR